MLEDTQGDGISKNSVMKVVLACGVFDIFHYGHLLHLQAARKLGDVLIVTVTADEAVNKGSGHPVFKLHQRMAVIRALAIVDDVRQHWKIEETIAQLRPSIYTKGREYEGRLPEQELVESYGGRVVFTDDEVYSSTELLAGGYLKIPCLDGR